MVTETDEADDEGMSDAEGGAPSPSSTKRTSSPTCNCERNSAESRFG